MKSIKTRLDGWVNIFTRRGIAGVDKQTGNQIRGDILLTEDVCRNIYRSDGWGKKIVARICSDMTRAWFMVAQDTDGAIVKYLNEIKAKKVFREALTWAKVFGGSVIVMIVDDGSGDMSLPLDETKIKKIDSLRVYDRYRVSHTQYVYDDPFDKKFGQTKIYQINPLNGSQNMVHETRVLKFDGVLTDERTYHDNDSWHESIYAALLQPLADLSGSYHAAKDIVDDFIQTILKVQGLQDMVANDQDDLIKKRLEIIDLGRHASNTILLDGEEDYSKLASSVAGLPDLLQKFQEAVAGIVDMPLTVLVGKSAGSLNATGDNEIRTWYDKVASYQEDEMLDQLTRLVQIAMLCKEGPTKGVELEEWSIKFNALWSPSENEMLSSRKLQMEIDSGYIDRNVLSSEEVALSRFGGSEYSFDTKLIEMDRDSIETESEDKDSSKEEETTEKESTEE